MDNVYLKGSKILVEVNIASKRLDFRIDTGTDVSLVNEQSCNCLCQPKLAAPERLRNALCAIMSFMVTFKHFVRFCNTETSIQFFVKKGGCTNLLGMNLLKKIGLARLYNTYLHNLETRTHAQGICKGVSMPIICSD